MIRDSVRQLAAAQSGDHILLVYENVPELLSFVVPFIKDGLAKREHCIYVASNLIPNRVIAALADGGVDVRRETARGAFLLLNGSVRDVAGLVEHARRRVAGAHARRAVGVRVAAELRWPLGVGVPDRLRADNDARLDRLCAPNVLTFACMYSRDQCHPDLLRQLVRSHTKVVGGDHVYLSLCQMFQRLDRADLETFVRSAQVRRRRKGELFYRQGDEATDVYVLTSGKVKLVARHEDGRGVILDIVTPGEMFGHVAALAAGARLVSAEALEDSRALVWGTPTILQRMLACPAVAVNASRMIAEQARGDWLSAIDLMTDRVERRLARLLPKFAQSVGRRFQSGDGIELPLAVQDLAEMAFTTPFTVSRILASWKRRNLVKIGRGQIRIVDLPGIVAMAQ